MSSSQLGDLSARIDTLNKWVINIGYDLNFYETYAVPFVLMTIGVVSITLIIVIYLAISHDTHERNLTKLRDLLGLNHKFEARLSTRSKLMELLKDGNGNDEV